MPAGAWTGSREHLEELADSLFATAAPVPATIAGLKMWLDASHIDSGDGVALTTWADRSGLGNSPTQATGSLKPLYRAAGLNGQPAVVFDGADDVLVLGSPVSTVIDNFTMVIVCRNDDPGSTGSVPLFVGTGASNGWGAAVSSDAGKIGAIWGGVAWDSTTTPLDDTADILIVERAAGTTTIYRNGVALSPTFANAPATPTLTTRIGEWVPLAVVFNGALAQALVYEAALTAQNRLDLNRYFGNRYGITVP